MKDPLKDAIHRVDEFLDRSYNEFASPNVSKGVYKQVHDRCNQSITELKGAIKQVMLLEEKHKNDPQVLDPLMAMNFFMDRMQKDMSARICEALSVQNPVLAMASLQILKHNWIEVKSAYSLFLEVTEKQSPVEKKQEAISKKKIDAFMDENAEYA